jgi:hypothetical protein
VGDAGGVLNGEIDGPLGAYSTGEWDLAEKIITGGDDGVYGRKAGEAMREWRVGEDQQGVTPS